MQRFHEKIMLKFHDKKMRKFRQQRKLCKKKKFLRKIKNSLKQMQSFSKKVHQKRQYFENTRKTHFQRGIYPRAQLMD